MRPVVPSAPLAGAAKRWKILPCTPAPIPSTRHGQIVANGIRIHHAVYGEGPPVILLHGALANADYWGHQIPAFAPHHTVVVMDSRGHGRSNRDLRPYSYDLLADDVVSLMDVLRMPRADVVGWSDGGTIGLNLAIRHPDRVGKLIAYAATANTAGTKFGAIINPAVVAFLKRAAHEYKAYSVTPKEYGSFFVQIAKMLANQPNLTDADLKTIVAPVLVVHGDHDETIKRKHAEYIASTIPGAELLILSDVSHFAFLQDPQLFNEAVLRFLGSERPTATG